MAKRCASNWRPIETAPDNEWVLGWGPNMGLMIVMRWNSAWEDTESFAQNPTHWQRLPEPPEEAP